MTFTIRVSTGANGSAPLGNTPVELGWAKPATPLGDPGRLIAKGTTSGNGLISFSFKAKPKELQGGKFYVSARKGGDYFFQQNEYYGIQKYDSIVSAAVHVPSKATLKIIYRNFNPASSTDYFQCLPYFFTYGSTGIPIEMKKPGGQLRNTHFFPGDGAFTQLELTGTTAGDQYTYFDIIKKKNGVRVDVRDSVYIGKGQTKTYEVAF
ncbi:MAG: hypothetical protein EOO14_00975 [Chitinophagaceae bacterium]|nr:MAG: hypothetical protein EOO14_00975 [Chitinophagaceae bacterium]